MKEKSKEFWQKERLFTLVMIGIAGGIYLLSRFIQLSVGTKVFLGFVLLLFLIILIGGVAMATGKKEEVIEKEDKEGTQLLSGFIRNVSANMAWVLRRSLFGSNIDTLEGYKAKREGWRFKIPGWHEDLGFVDLSPQPRDPESITVNTKDNQTAIIDWRIVTRISDPVKFIVKVDGNREEFENQRATVIFNQLSSQKTQEELTKFSAEELEEWAKDGRKIFNEKMGYLGIEADHLEIQKILMPEEIRAAAEYATVTEKRKEVAATKGEELKTIIETTKSDPTKIVMTDMFRDILTNMADVVVNAFRTYRETKQGGEEE